MRDPKRRLKIKVVQSDGEFWFMSYVSDFPDWKIIMFPVATGTPCLAISLAIKIWTE